MEGCPSDEMLAALTDGLLDAEASARVHAHVDTCPGCQALLAGLPADPAPPAPTANADREAETRDFAAGDLLGGRYRLERPLGGGGMGTVWMATHLGTDRRVAIKLPRRDLLVEPTARARFLREARVLGRIEHENLVPVHDAFEERGRPVLVMDLLDGESLGDYLRREGRLPLVEVARLFPGALAAVERAHQAGIVHRDLKPDNLFLVRAASGARSLRVLDFGLAKRLDDSASDPAATTTLTGRGEILGTPPYMAPEQLAGDEISDDLLPRIDVWSFGVILYECLAGRRPFTAATLSKYALRITAGARDPLSVAAPGLPPDVVALVEKMLAVEPGARCSDLREAIEVLSRHGGDAADRRDARRPEERAKGAPRRAMAWVAGALLLAAGIGGAWRSMGSPAATTVGRAAMGARASAPPTPAPASAAATAPGSSSAIAAGATTSATPVDRGGAAPVARTPCERTFGATLSSALCRIPKLAMRGAAYRTALEEQEEHGPVEKARAAAAHESFLERLAACDGHETCLLDRLRAATARSNVIDCDRALSRDARAICGSASLAEQQGVLAALYAADLADYARLRRRFRRGPDGAYLVADGNGPARAVPSAPQFSRDQADWIFERHRCGEDAACLERTLSARIVALKKIRRALLGSDAP
jgi:serine/threonine-protein kinase